MGGGVLSVIKNLLRFSDHALLENHIIYTINKSLLPDFTMPVLEGAKSQQLFYYSASHNFYYTCRQLAKLLPDDKAIIVAHDWMELGMLSNLGLQNPVVQVLHGNYGYYYELAKKHRDAVDAFICVSHPIANTLKEQLPYRYDDIYEAHFPVSAAIVSAKQKEVLQLIYFAGNLTDINKQFDIITRIAEKLQDNAGNYFFTIAGAGITEKQFHERWPIGMTNRVRFMGELANETIQGLLLNQDIFLLPSLAEGLPVSLVEAMKAGAVPLITEWPGGTDNLVLAGETGFTFEAGDVAGYCNCIEYLVANRELLKSISVNAVKRANYLFDPKKNTHRYEHIFAMAGMGQQKKKRAIKIYGSRLDQPWLSNLITYTWRRFNKK